MGREELHLLVARQWKEKRGIETQMYFSFCSILQLRGSRVTAPLRGELRGAVVQGIFKSLLYQNFKHSKPIFPISGSTWAE